MTDLHLSCNLRTPKAGGGVVERWTKLSLDRERLTAKAVALVEILGSIHVSGIPDTVTARDEIIIRSVQTRREMMADWTADRRELKEAQAEAFGIDLDRNDEAIFYDWGPLKANDDGTYDEYAYVERMAGRIPLGYWPLKRVGEAPGSAQSLQEAADQATTELSALLTISEVCALAGIATSTWRSYVARGQAPAPTVHRERTPFWAKEGVDQWLDARASKGA